jgi:hypothetical protein
MVCPATSTATSNTSASTMPGSATRRHSRYSTREVTSSAIPPSIAQTI